MDSSRFLSIFKSNPPRRYGLIPIEKKGESRFKKIFGGKRDESAANGGYVCPFTYCDPYVAEGRRITGRKNDESAANREYVCPFTYCDPYVAEGRRITGLRQYPVEKEKSFIDILHERKMSLFYGTPGEEDPNSEYDRPYIGGVFDLEKTKEEEKMKKKEEKKMKKKEGKRVKRKEEENKMKEKEEENMSWDEV